MKTGNYQLTMIMACGLGITASLAFTQEGPATMLYVATTGNDRWSGLLPEPNADRTDGPFASLARAQAAVRDIKKQGSTRPVNVVVRAGVYELKGTLRFTSEDGGAESCPITYQTQPGEEVVIRGGRSISGWKLYRDGIYKADLKAQGMEGVSFHQLFYRGKRQILARHPNFDPKHPRTGGLAYVEARGPNPPEQFFYEEGTIPFEKWGDVPQAEVLTTFGRGWNFAITPILNVDTKHRLITVRRVRRPFEPENRFIIQNVLAALDAPGEWYLDRKTSVLYFWPPEGEPVDGDVVAPLIDHLIEVKGAIPYPHGYLKVGFKGSKDDFPMPADTPPAKPVEYLSFKGFRFDCARQDAIRFIGARNCSVIGCTVTNVGAVGINLGGVANAHLEVGNPRVVPAEGFSGGVGGGGQNLLFNDPCQKCRVAGNDIWAVGSDGIFLYGTGNVAENNHVYNSGLFDKDCACINAFGEENVARRNELHDVPRNAVFLKGIGNVIELNNIHHTMLETCDGGAIRMCQRNLEIRGNSIRFNKIVDTIGYGYPMGGNYQSPYYSWGVYLDDFTCGVTVYGNIIVRTGRGGIHVHGGSDNIVENNVIVDAGQYQFENNPIRQHAVTGNRVQHNIFYYDGAEAYLYRCGKWLDGSVAWGNNLVWCRKGNLKVLLGMRNEIEGWEAWQKAGIEKDSVLADAMFQSPEADDYRLRPGSPASRIGFAKIPVVRIGCYESDERASWPLRVMPGLVREAPLLRVAPVRPLREDFERDAALRPPRRGDVSAPGRSSIRVTDELAASGKQSLKFVDALGLPNRWQPRIYYSMDFREGAVGFSCDFRLDGKMPPDMVVDFRQYSDAGGREYLSGPIFSTSSKGELAVAGKALTKAPFDKWFRIEISMTLGDIASDHYDMLVTVQDAEPKRFRLPYRSVGFKRLQRIVIMSNGQERSVFYVDNVTCSPIAQRGEQ